MQSRGADRQAGKPSRAAAALAALAASVALAGTCRAAGLIGVGYSLNWDETVTKTDAETTSTWTYKHTLDVRYAGFMSPVVQNEISLKIDQEIKSQGEPRRITRLSPVITLGYKGSSWNAGAKRTMDDSNEPGKSAKITDSYFVELLYVPPRDTLPDLKAKYTLDKDQEAGTTDTAKHALTTSSVYKPNAWLDVKLEYGKGWAVDNLKPDADTEDEKVGVGVGIRHVVSRKLRVSTEWRTSETRAATLLSGGGATNERREQDHTWRNALAFRPFRDTTFDAAYDFDLKEDFKTGDHTYTKNTKASVAQKITVFELKGDVSRNISEARHTDDDNQKTEDTWTVECRTKLSKLFDVSVKYQSKNTKEVHFLDSTRDTSSGSNSSSATWNGDLTAFWKASATYDKTDTIDRGVTTTIDTKYGLKSTLDFKAVRLTLEPSYDMIFKEDRVLAPPEESEIRDAKVRIAWDMLATGNITAKLDHSFGRKVDSALENIQRTDSSNFNINWMQPLPNWNVGIGVTRSATDTSEDDLPPDISANFNFKADYKFDPLTFGASYKYDRKKLTDDSEAIDLKTSWTTLRWDLSLTYSFKKTFSEKLDEGYTIGVAFKYNL